MKNRLTLAPSFLIAAGQDIVMSAAAQNVTTTESPATVPTVANSDRVTEGCDKVDHIVFDKFIHKPVYRIGVHSTLELDETYEEYSKILGEYLTETAGKVFDPPVKFEVVASYFDSLLAAIDNEDVDFFYANPYVKTNTTCVRGLHALNSL
jgi:hypothetical protein